MDDSTSMISILDSSILNDIKKYIGPSIAYEVFDMDILMNINAAFFTLYQLGVGSSKNVFTIMDANVLWSEFSDDVNIVSAVKQYVYLKVRNVFDPPTSSYVLTAYESQIQELEWRLREMAAGMFDEDEDEEDNGCCDGPETPEEPGDSGYVLPIATSSRLGGVKIGENVNVDDEGRISVDDPVLSDDDMVTKDDVHDLVNRVFRGDGPVLYSEDGEPKPDEPEDDSGNLDDGYVLPIATADRLGGVMIGKNVNINDAGVISVDSVIIAEEDLASSEDVKNMLDNVFREE